MPEKGKIPPQLKPFIFKKGNKASPGRTKDTMKDFARKYFKDLSTEERYEFLNSIAPDVVWKMAEGQPKQEVESELNLKVEKLEEIQKVTKEILNDKD